MTFLFSSTIVLVEELVDSDFHQENKCSHDGTVPIEEHHVPVQEQYKQPSYCRLSETSCFAESCVSKGVGRAHVVTGSITGVGVRCYMFP